LILFGYGGEFDISWIKGEDTNEFYENKGNCYNYFGNTAHFLLWRKAISMTMDKGLQTYLR